METYDDDDDTHFCIKCHLTINGLDNYVRHRQSGCRPPEVKQETVHEPPTTPTTVTYPEILNADAFFSSLELQSSAKSNSTSRNRGNVERERKIGKIEDKKKKSRKGQEPDDVSTKEKLMTMTPPVDTDLDDLMDHLGIPSLVGFPEIVAPTGNKTIAGIATGKSSSAVSSSKVTNDENLRVSPVDVLEPSSKVSSETKTNTDSQRIDQEQGEWLGNAMLEDLDVNVEVETKDPEHGELASYEDYDYRQDEDSDEDSPDEDAGDDDSYSDDEDADDRDYPRLGHTGGKWKPNEPLQDIDRLNDDDLEQDDDNPENQPEPQTGGKWKPADSSQLQRSQTDDEVAIKDPASSLPASTTSKRESPGSGHTRGKWMPGSTGDTDSGYWCDPCGRKLASRLVYNRHLLSDLHARRAVREIDGDLKLPRGVGPLVRRRTNGKRPRTIDDVKSRSEFGTNSVTNTGTTTKKTRNREKEVLWCEMCYARVRRAQMGKHLLSHYHCRVVAANPCISLKSRQFILNNMGNIVRQCPFQCASCRFYCNTEETFLLHWRSKLHATRFDDTGGHYECTVCNFWCVANEGMEYHLRSPGHREIVSMMNGSVPVVIRRQRSITCESCNQHFRYNVKLRFHVRQTGHRGNLTATDDYQDKIACRLCSRVVRSVVALQRHQLSCHDPETDVDYEDAKSVVYPSAPYYCSFCGLNFATARQAVLHRRTPRHKEIVKAQKLSDDTRSLARQCPHCGLKQSNLADHKDHLLDRHPELCHRCPQCGMLFALPQDVSRHTKTVECKKTMSKDSDESTGSDDAWSCAKCRFATDSKAELLFHDALHTGAIEANANEQADVGNSNDKRLPKYRCSMCEKTFVKSSLRNHLRSHTGERPFCCVKCSASFPRRSDLNAHRKTCKTTSGTSIKWPKGTGPSRQRNHTCSECSTSFYTNFTEHQWVSYRQTYRGSFLWRRIKTRVNYRWEVRSVWKNVEECCSGYERRISENHPCMPVCQSHCTNGQCIEPNLCTCDAGYSAVMTDGLSRCEPRCAENGQLDCGDHASCVAPDTCVCHDGYVGSIVQRNESGLLSLSCTPKCQPTCGENAICASPNNCACAVGYVRRKTEKSADDGFNCEPFCSPECGKNMNCFAPDNCKCDNGYGIGSFGNMTIVSASDGPQMCLPICDPSCTNGVCTKPNYCECQNGYQKNPAKSSQVCEPICDPSCTNGVCTKLNYCECQNGYQKNPAKSSQVCEPICDPSCTNGVCTKPNYCECQNGYQKNPAKSSQVCEPICDSPCINGVCTKPNYCECQNGYQKNPAKSSQVCEPICDSPCINGICTKPNYCECQNGYQKNPAKSSQVCEPICDSPCINGICTKPNYCECQNGYQKHPAKSSQACEPICDPVCKKNENCVAPDVCQCDLGYRPESVAPNATECSPICDPTCVNARCESPNDCVCLAGYEKNVVDHSVCDPICPDGCLNATCTYPDHCECHDGYVKTWSTKDAFEGQNVSDNTCVPSCSGQCDNGRCIAPGQCICDQGYVVNTKLIIVTSNETTNDYADGENVTMTTNDTFVQFCQPICEVDCPNGSKCLYPNQCETNSSHSINGNNDCGENGDFWDENGECVCHYGWTGRKCEEPSLCGLVFESDLVNDDESTTLQSIIVEANETTESTYYTFDDAATISGYDESNRFIGWRGPMCIEECQHTMISSELSGNRSDEVPVNCYLVDSRNATSGVTFVENEVTIANCRNETVICFIEVQSPCNLPKLKIIRESSGGLIAGVIGVIIVSIAISSVTGWAIYRRRRRTFELSPTVSMTNSVMLIPPEWTDPSSTNEESAFL